MGTTALKDINGIPVKTVVNNSSNVFKGLVYSHGYNMGDFDRHKEGLITQHGPAKVEEVMWIKSRNNSGKHLLLSFWSAMPSHIDIPGKMARTKVYGCKRQPSICTRCL